MDLTAISREQACVTVAVMGPTGSGKSSLIKAMTGREDIIVGNNLNPETSIVQAYETEIDEIKFILIDTPGFDDAYLSNHEVLHRIGSWLEESRPGTVLTGIIYLYRISDNRLQGSAQRTFRMFHKLCGVDYSRNIIMATTFWDKVDEEVGAQREEQLRESQGWRDMFARGSKLERITEYSEAKHILLSLLEVRPKNIQMQIDLQRGANLKDVVASYADNENMRALRAHQSEEERRLVETRRQIEAKQEAARQAQAEKEEARRQKEWEKERKKDKRIAYSQAVREKRMEKKVQAEREKRETAQERRMLEQYRMEESVRRIREARMEREELAASARRAAQRARIERQGLNSQTASSSSSSSGASCSPWCVLIILVLVGVIGLVVVVVKTRSL